MCFFLLVAILVLFFAYNIFAMIWNYFSTGKKPPLDWPK
jgi:hypothetical protein